MYRDIHGNMFPILISVTVNSFIIDIGFLRYVEKRLTVKSNMLVNARYPNWRDRN